MRPAGWKGMMSYPIMMAVRLLEYHGRMEVGGVSGCPLSTMLRRPLSKHLTWHWVWPYLRYGHSYGSINVLSGLGHRPAA